jgi:hypothetical protein
MLIWILAIVLFAVFGALGYLKGAIRSLFPLLGLLVGVFLAVPLGPLVRPLVPLVGLSNPIWSWLLPPVIVFFLLSAIFIVVGFLVHHKVNLYYKYHTDDHQRLSWERLNQRVGACFGLLAGAGYTILLGLVIYVLGYLSVQLSAGDNDPAVIRYLNQARQDLRSSGLEKTVAALDPAPEKYYEAVDVIGLMRHNPLLDSRLASYPPFLTLGERPEFLDIATDAEWQNMWASQASVAQILSHPKTQAILGNQDALQQLEQIDLQDLMAYLKTNVPSAKYDQPILGRWEVDPYLTLQQEKRHKIGMTSMEMRKLRQNVEMIKGFKLVVAPDGSAKLKGPDVAQLIKQLADAARAAMEAAQAQAAAAAAAAAGAAPAPTAGPSGPSAMSQQMARRYGRQATQAPAPAPVPAPVVLAPAAVAAPPPPSPAVIAAELAKLSTVVLAQGNWKEEGGKYQVTLQAQNELNQFVGTKRSSTIQAVVRDNRLYLTEGNQTMVMARY